MWNRVGHPGGIVRSTPNGWDYCGSARVTHDKNPAEPAACFPLESPQARPASFSPEQMSLLRGRIYNRRKKPAHGRAGRDFSEDQNDPPKSTAESLAEKHGVSAPTIKRDGRFAESVDALVLG